MLAAAGWLAAGATLVSQGAQRPAPLQPLPLTQLDERAPSKDLVSRTVTLAFAQPVPVQEVLLAVLRDTSLSLIPEPTVTGSFVGDLKNVTVRQALDAVLSPMGLDYTVDDRFVRVFRKPRETRIFDLDYIATERVTTTTVGESGAATVTTTTRADVFADLARGVQALLSEQATFNVDRKVGLLQVTDVPDRLDRVTAYLDAVRDRTHRQAQIEARVLEVGLEDEKATGIDWSMVRARLTGAQTPAPGAAAPRSAVSGLRVTDVGRLLAALAEQGTVATIASPRLLTMNNEPALVQTEAVTFSVTPHVASDAVVTLSLSPIVRAPAKAAIDLLARVSDGETLVVSGLTRDRETRERKSVGVAGGWFGRGTVVTKRRLELVVLLTPTVVNRVVGQ